MVSWALREQRGKKQGGGKLEFTEENSVLEYHKTTEKEKRIICGWKYNGKYAIYNNPPYEEQLEKQQGFANSRNNYDSFYDVT